MKTSGEHGGGGGRGAGREGPVEAGGPEPNPGGRPEGAASAVRERLGDDPKALIEVLLEIALDTSQRAADRIRACAEILDRGWGKAPAYAPIEHVDPLGLDELDAAIQAIAEQLRAQHASADAN